MKKFANFVRLYFPYITTFFPNFGILLLLKDFFREFVFFTILKYSLFIMQIVITIYHFQFICADRHRLQNQKTTDTVHLSL